MTGASWDAQLVAALWAAAFGAAASPLTLLYGIRLRPVERFAADFLATVLIGAAFFLSSETGARGMVTAYCAASFLLSLMLARKGLLRLGALLQKNSPDSSCGGNACRENGQGLPNGTLFGMTTVQLLLHRRIIRGEPQDITLLFLVGKAGDEVGVGKLTDGIDHLFASVQQLFEAYVYPLLRRAGALRKGTSRFPVIGALFKAPLCFVG